MSYQINWEIQALDLAVGFLSDDPSGVAALWERIDPLAGEPRPPQSFPYGHRIYGVCGLDAIACSTRSTKAGR